MSAERRPSGALVSDNTTSLSSSSPVAAPLTRKEQIQRQDSGAVTVPSFSSFRAQAAPTSSTSTAVPVRRKPLQSRLPSSGPGGADPHPWAPVVPPPPPADVSRPRPASTTSSAAVVVRDLDQYPHGDSPLAGQSSDAFASIDARTAPAPSLQRQSHAPARAADLPPLGPAFGGPVSAQRDLQTVPDMTLHTSRQPAHLNLQVDDKLRNASQASDESYDSTSTSKPRSPGTKLTSFFGWKSASPGPASSSTSISDKASSPGPSPRSPKLPTRVLPATIDVPKANASLNAAITGQTTPPKMDEMEEELRDISAELASSIRREMDLEDLVERLQAEAVMPPPQNRRTSDYFSDSGNSSVRYPAGEPDSKDLELEKMQRRTEQEKAQLKLDLTQRVQEERSRRVALESHIQQLEERVHKVDRDQLQSVDATGRAKELEASVDDLRRRLSEERRVKENFEDLLTALRGEIHEHRNERDNLRDEIVPRLRARVEGLELEAAEFQKLTYENARMQQELQSLKNENTTLMNARKLQLEMQSQQTRINSIAEEGPGPSGPALSRSISVARAGTRSGSLTRSNSAKERESRESLADRVKDIEAQRDALHRALKSLLDRQEYQNREADKRIRALEMERDRALAGSPRKGYDRDVSNLREEIDHLRRRADDALEQKWQCEKGLSGLKMDLDRAEQETSSLRTLLQEHDILLPQASDRAAQGPRPATSASLEKAYRELQTTHALSLARIQELEGHGQGVNGSQLAAANAETEKTMELLRNSISDAEAERDFAQKQAEQYRLQAESLQKSEGNYMVEEQTLAGQLRASALRVEELATQVRQQLASNNTLRQRLAEAIGRGEREQRTSAERISELQSKLKALEDKVMVAQQHSEEAVAKHEDELRELRDGHAAALQRMKSGFMSPNRFSPKSPLSPLFLTRSPKLDFTTTGQAMSMNEGTRTAFLAKKVEELETALSLADKEMEEVVSRMNMAQIEVMELQSERDEAMRQTRRLQAEINQERLKVKAVIA
ncbi:MAG: hypothetical protein M1832_001219 [Thelocarpon impressellum]|nr:MAG: hypothetical protein M1832_001219 [Thelocarpon impressellum]